MRSSGLVLGLLAAALLVSGCTEEEGDPLDRARELAYEGRHDQALEAVERLLLDLEDQPGEARLRAETLELGARLAELFLDAPQRAVRYYGALVKAAPGTPAARRARERLAQIHLEALDDPAGAVVQWQALLEEYADDAEADRWRYDLLRAQFRLGDWNEVARGAKAFLEARPDSPWADDTRYLVGLAYQMAGDQEAARAAFEAVWTRHPDSELAPRARLEAGACLAELGREDEALTLWRSALARHPDPSIVQMKIDRLEARLSAQHSRSRRHVLAR